MALIIIIAIIILIGFVFILLTSSSGSSVLLFCSFLGLLIVSGLDVFFKNREEIKLKEEAERKSFYNEPKDTLSFKIENVIPVEIELEKESSSLFSSSTIIKNIKLNLLKGGNKKVLDLSVSPRIIGDSITTIALKKDSVSFGELVKHTDFLKNDNWNVVRNGSLDIDYIILPNKNL